MGGDDGSGNRRSLCVYCGSSRGTRPEFVDAAAVLGRTLAEQSVELVYGGGKVGLMGVLADACLDAGGRVIGVLPERLATVELSHDGCTELHIVPDMHARKALMADRATAFAALPGGIGTLEELLEIATWRQIGYHNKPVFVVNIGGFYDPLLALFDEIERDGFLRNKGGDGELFTIVDSVEELWATWQTAS